MALEQGNTPLVESVDKAFSKAIKRSKGKKWTGSGKSKQAGQWNGDKKKIEAVTIWTTTGSMSKTEEMTGVPAGTLRRWKTEPWWYEYEGRIRQERDAELDQKFSRIVDKTLDQIDDRVVSGDWQLTKDGQQVRIPVKARDLGVLAGVIFDKQRTIRNQPTRSAHISTEELLTNLATKFAEAVTSGTKIHKVTQGKIIDVTPEEGTPST